jgi:hypothetical protein
MFVFAVSLYGNPFTPEKDGFLPWKRIHQWQAVDAISFMIVSFTMTSIYFLPLLFIPLEIESGKQFKNDPKYLNRIGVVIPCHKSADEIGAVVKQIIKYIPPGNVVICDNGNFDWPKDNTFEVVKAVHPDIVYTFTSQGHKTRALWTGCHRLPRHCEYIMHIDDDTMISDNFVFDESHFTTKGAENVVAVAFLRQAHRMNRCTNFIDFWYKITDHFHATQAHITTRCFVPGPAGKLGIFTPLTYACLQCVTCRPMEKREIRANIRAPPSSALWRGHLRRLHHPQPCKLPILHLIS